MRAPRRVDSVDRARTLRAGAGKMRRGLTGVFVVLMTAHCGAPRLKYPESLQSENPGERIEAIKRAADRQDVSAIGVLVDRLDDEDEAVRFYAILALKKLTGRDMGYEYHAPQQERYRAVKRWRRWLAQPDRSGAETRHDDIDTSAAGGPDA